MEVDGALPGSASTRDCGDTSETPDDREWREWKEWKEWQAWKRMRQLRDREPRVSSDVTPPGNIPAQLPVQQGKREDPTDSLGPSETRTQYVLSGQATGWAAMEKVVREFDEEKLQNCKEDIDTLLVFAGLFSATLTAFLVESYQRLSEDTAGETLQAIRQLTAQTASYHIIGGLLNATVYAPTTPAPFQPLAADIRVNVLWFASLLFSLITASFGILVKQWLREYLAVDNPAPQARLRVRHLRYPQLARWKVFEIAAVLPILLQISLGLFFVGMCYFTASVHPSVRNTTLPLVAGWAFCFAAVTLLPVFFPLCPYRTTFLKRIITAFHSYIVRHATRIEFPPGYFRLVSLWRRRYLHWWACIGAALTDSNEANATSRADHDTDILIAVDTILSNDELLKTTLAEALQQSHPRASHMLSFIRSILYNRLQPSIDVVTADSFPVPLVDLQPLGLQARSAISSILCQYLASRVTAVLCWDVLAQIIFSAMLSSLGQPMPATVVRLLRESLPAQRGEGLPVRRRELRFEVRWLIDANGQLEEDAARLYIQSFRLILPHSPVDTNASVIRFITGTLLLHQQLSHGLDIHEDRHDYVRGLESMLASWPWRTVSNALKLEMAQFLVVNLEHLLYVLLADDPPTPQVLHEVSPCFRGSLVALFTGITSLSISSYLQIWTNDILALIMAHKTSASELVRVVAQTPPQQLLDFISAMGLLSPTLNGDFLLQHSANLFHEVASIEVMPRTAVLNICYFYIFLIFKLPPTFLDDTTMPTFANTFTGLATRISRTFHCGMTRTDVGDGSERDAVELAAACLNKIHQDNQVFSPPRSSAPGLFSIQLMEVLNRFLTDDHYRAHWDQDCALRWIQFRDNLTASERLRRLGFGVELA